MSMNATVEELNIGDVFVFKGDMTLYTYMGIFSYNRGDYLVYKTGSSPCIKRLDLSEQIQVMK